MDANKAELEKRAEQQRADLVPCTCYCACEAPVKPEIRVCFNCRFNAHTWKEER